MNACTNLTDEDRERLRGLLLQGAQSAPAFQADADYFEKLRTKIRGREAI
jgi:antitoxin ParD1/3/4